MRIRNPLWSQSEFPHLTVKLIWENHWNRWKIRRSATSKSLLQTTVRRMERRKWFGWNFLKSAVFIRKIRGMPPRKTKWRIMPAAGIWSSMIPMIFSCRMRWKGCMPRLQMIRTDAVTGSILQLTPLVRDFRQNQKWRSFQTAIFSPIWSCISSCIVAALWCLWSYSGRQVVMMWVCNAVMIINWLLSWRLPGLDSMR